VQEKLDKEVLEIRPPGFVRDFPGLLEFTLSFQEMQQVVGVGSPGDDLYAPGDPTWMAALEGASGVYIVHSDEGLSYVGAAYGAGGFLGRWKTYARTSAASSGPDDTSGLRGNIGMGRFLTEGPEEQQRRRLLGLRFSILHVMHRSAPKELVESMETQFKEKFRSRDARWGLNRN